MPNVNAPMKMCLSFLIALLASLSLAAQGVESPLENMPAETVLAMKVDTPFPANTRSIDLIEKNRELDDQQTYLTEAKIFAAKSEKERIIRSGREFKIQKVVKGKERYVLYYGDNSKDVNNYHYITVSSQCGQIKCLSRFFDIRLPAVEDF